MRCGCEVDGHARAQVCAPVEFSAVNLALNGLLGHRIAVGFD